MRVRIEHMLGHACSVSCILVSHPARPVDVHEWFYLCGAKMAQGNFRAFDAGSEILRCCLSTVYFSKGLAPPLPPLNQTL